MRILLLGASGFIGRELLAALAARGHEVVAAVRRTPPVPPAAAHSVVAIDLERATAPEHWSQPLSGCDAVVNCAGLLQGSWSRSIDAVHAAAPIALFRACERSGVRRVVQVSAISADPGAGTRYAATKHAADEFLRASALDWVVLRPSLVHARGAYGGTALFRAMAALPFAIPLPGDGRQAFQPIHVADLARVVAQSLETDALVRRTLDPVGPEVVTLREMLQGYRRWLGIAPVPPVAIPGTVVTLACRVGDVLGGPLNSTARAQLDFGNTGDAAAFEQAIGWRGIGWHDALAREPAHAQDLWHARLYFVRPGLRWSLALLWLVSGIAGAYAIPAWALPISAQAGMPLSAAAALLAFACLADVAVAWLLVWRWRPRATALAQVLLICVYTLVATWLWPPMWGDPLGVLLKNLPILAAVLALGAIEQAR